MKEFYFILDTHIFPLRQLQLGVLIFPSDRESSQTKLVVQIKKRCYRRLKKLNHKQRNDMCINFLGSLYKTNFAIILSITEMNKLWLNLLSTAYFYNLHILQNRDPNAEKFVNDINIFHKCIGRKIMYIEIYYMKKNPREPRDKYYHLFQELKVFKNFFSVLLFLDKK
jgi:hypothetical protein